MIISFYIEYRTNWGEEVRVAGSIPELGGTNAAKALSLNSDDGIHWFIEIEAKLPACKFIEYNYCVYRNGEVIRREWMAFPRRIYLSNDRNKEYKMCDCWRTLPSQQYFYSSAFTESLIAHRERNGVPKIYTKGLRIKVSAPQISSDYCLAISGNQDALGNWEPEKACMMSDVDFPEWQVELDVAGLNFPVEYKFILYNKKEKRLEAWEDNANRRINYFEIMDYETYVISDRHANFALPEWKGAGVAVPVFSLRSEKSYGVGDFGDLKKMVDWAVCTGQKVVQILPVNDTTITHAWTDSYPYNSISIYAFHPVYTDLDKLGRLKNKEKMAAFDKKQKKLNALPALDYEQVTALKWEYFHLIFAQEGDKVLASAAFGAFFASNKEWLQPYAAFSYLRDLYKTPDFRHWPEYAVYNAGEIEKLCSPQAPHYREIAIYYYIQFNLHLQLLEATTYARSQGVVLKGDIPIGISRNSVEAWTEPHYFNLDGQAGAPPDDFSVNGQNWGFPTYNWDVMEQDGYKWWMKRFRKMSEYFDAYRIDHILGFFRIWEIPMNAVHGLLGQFVPSLPLSRQEIENYGLSFRDDSFLNPFISEASIMQIFREHTEYVKKTFVEPMCEEGRYRMKPGFDTQRKVEAFFAGKTDDDSNWMREGLYALISDVLFIRDKKDPEKFHPRISVQHDFIYNALSEAEKNMFNRLYDDYYYRRHNEFWHQQAMKKLPRLTQSTRMLVCGEDLGMIPESVSWTMNDLQILSLEIQRMPKEAGHEFGDPSHYAYRSVCTISTHDMSTLRGWWEEDSQRTQRYYNQILGHYGTAPETATPEICEEVVRSHLYGKSMLCIIALQDWLGMDAEWRNPDIQSERINVPANPKNYWRYRMHITLEQLMKAGGLNLKIKELINKTGRG